MAKKLTNEEFKKRVWEKNEHVRNGELEIRGGYVNYDTPIASYCNIHDIAWDARPKSLLLGRNCRKCGYIKNGQARAMTYEEFIKRISVFDNGIEAVGNYLGLNKEMDFICSKGHSWSTVAKIILLGEGCPYCAGRRIWIGFNDLWTTRPDIAALLKNRDDGYRYTAGSGQRADFKCPDCQAEYSKTIVDVCTYGFSCSNCSDGVSYPNKFARAFLSQLNIDTVEHEYKPYWLKPYSFDNYFEYSGCKYILEMDGGLGHGKAKFNSKERDTIGVERDTYKDALAKERGIKIIRIDCDYKNKDRFTYIKNNIINSELSLLFDLSVIDWVLCDNRAKSKLIIQAASLYNQGLCLAEIKSVLNYSKITIAKWLRQAKNIGLCDYDAKEAQSRGARFARKPTIQN